MLYGLKMERFDNNMILYRPVGLQEMELIYDNGMKAFPASLPQQPIFYPVLQLEYARKIAADWNAKNGQYAGYVTQFKLEDEYLSQFEEHTIGESQYQEFWIPTEELEAFNHHIIGAIKVVEAYFGDTFQGFVPEKFGLQGNNAVAQFTLLTNSYIYKRMEFYLEIKRNHKAIFLNYPFWQTYEFKNPVLKEKVLQAIKEAWFTSFPQNPLPLPVHADIAPMVQRDPPSLANPIHKDFSPPKQTDTHSFGNPVHEDLPSVKKSVSQSPENPVDQPMIPVEQTRPRAYFWKGLELGLSGQYQEAIDELSKAVEEDPDHVVAHTSLGVAFHRLAEDDRALSCYETALKIDPQYAEAHYFRGNILYRLGNDREAIAEYMIAIGLEPDLLEAHLKNIPQDRLTDYTPSPAGIHRLAKPANRILHLNKSLEGNPRQASLFKERAAQYYRLGNYEQAVTDYSSSLALQPDDASALHFRGLAYEQMRQLERAREDYQRAAAVNPHLSDEYIDRGVTYGKMGNFRQSVDSLTEGIRLAPQNPNGYFNRGTTHFMQGDFESAIDDFSSAIRLSPNNEAAYYWRGVSNEKAGHQSEAINDYRQFLALSQDVNAREEIEHKLSQWNAGEPGSASGRSAVPGDRQKANQLQSEQPDQDSDLHGLIVALGERALDSTWFGSGVNCHGENAEELYALTAQNKPIEGHDLLQIASGIHQTIEGDFEAYNAGATSPWIFIRAWDGNGFYIETNDPEIKERLKMHFQRVEDVEGASPSYESLFIFR